MILGKLFKFITDKLADAAGLPEVMKEDYAAMTGGEALGFIIEAINDAITRGWLNKAVSGFLALGVGLAAIKMDLDPSTKMELLATGNHLVSRLLDAKPRDYQELAESIRELMNAIKLGDWSLALKSGLRPIEEHKAMLESLGIIKGKYAPPSKQITAEAVTITKPTRVRKFR